MKITTHKNKEDFLKELRQETALRDITFRDMATWLKLDPAQVSRMFKGTQTFPLEYLDVILKRARIAPNLYADLQKVIRRGIT